MTIRAALVAARPFVLACLLGCAIGGVIATGVGAVVGIRSLISRAERDAARLDTCLSLAGTSSSTSHELAARLLSVRDAVATLPPCSDLPPECGTKEH